eukprot:CAMPEP_0201487582 /NCGR_PEP_ID=MMETSP0151_2-20130828/13876_1 /ASSEMBLY_ACC=CAM_ASM_000257 /TAXON_ID=200890 /ORGANISM="Paramoeba atlantica, Strain 621/1 / CCAP 1560/9" /LENGTH=268 /DNA_ID=CAMNT_0047872659 /DNA_START=48 /DNA_END=854 /DNA_ORIENTATION=-
MSKQELVDWAKEQDWDEVLENEACRKAMAQLRSAASGGDDAGDAGDDEDDCRRIKLVVVGDGAVGKTCLLISFATGEFPVEYVPTVFENYSAKMKINDKAVFLHLWDTAGQEDYDRLRPLSYPDSDIVLLCFSTTSKNSYDSVMEKWNPEIKHYLPNTPVILVGTKVDLRDSRLDDPNAEKTEYVTKEEGEKLQEEIKAVRYMEVSAKAACDVGGGGLQEVFLECVKTVMTELEDDDDEDEDSEKPGDGRAKKPAQKPKKNSGGCVLL